MAGSPEEEKLPTGNILTRVSYISFGDGHESNSDSICLEEVLESQWKEADLCKKEEGKRYLYSLVT